MCIEENHTCRHKQHQLDQGMIYHMQQRTMDRQNIFLSKQSLHSDTHQDKTDLGHGGAGQRPFQIQREHGQHRPQRHGDDTQRQHQHSPVSVM